MPSDHFTAKKFKWEKEAKLTLTRLEVQLYKEVEDPVITKQKAIYNMKHLFLCHF